MSSPRQAGKECPHSLSTPDGIKKFNPLSVSLLGRLAK
jgi:hypothetical protein